MIYAKSFFKDVVISISIVVIITVSTVSWYALTSFRNDHVDNTIANYRVNSNRNDTKINDTEITYHLKNYTTRVILTASLTSHIPKKTERPITAINERTSNSN